MSSGQSVPSREPRPEKDSAPERRLAPRPFRAASQPDARAHIIPNGGRLYDTPLPGFLTSWDRCYIVIISPESQPTLPAKLDAPSRPPQHRRSKMTIRPPLPAISRLVGGCRVQASGNCQNVPAGAAFLSAAERQMSDR